MNINDLFRHQLDSDCGVLFFLGETVKTVGTHENFPVEIELSVLKIKRENLNDLMGVWEVSPTLGTENLPRLRRI